MTRVVLAFAALLLLAGCAVPLAPGYEIEQEQIEVRYLSASPPRLHIRASFRLKNIGNAALEFVEAALPDDQSFGRQDLRAQVDGRDAALSTAGDAGARSVQIRFDPPWPQKQRRNLEIEYDLAPASPGHDALAVNDGAFHIRGAAVFPRLRAPKGALAKGGQKPREISLAIQAPADFRILAADREQEARRRDAGTEARFRIPKQELDPFIVAGRYQERRLKTAGGELFFWSFEPLAAEQAQLAATRLAATLNAYRAAFGPLEKTAPPIGLVETSAQLAPSAFASGDAAGVAVPSGALLNRQAFALGIASDAFLDLAEREFAHLWFGRAIAPRKEVQRVLGEGLAEYATVVAAEARGGEAARHIRAALLLHWFDESRRKAPDKPLLRIESSDSFEQRAFGYSKGALFFVALEDRYGKENVRRALARIVRSLRGGYFGYPELMSALELETQQKLGEFFRLWLDQTGIPAEVRARYEGKPEEKK